MCKLMVFIYLWQKDHKNIYHIFEMEILFITFLIISYQRERDV
jgi:hypothetical protein